MRWNTAPKKRGNADPTAFHLQTLPVTLAELAEDAGHMGYNHTYYPGSAEWEEERARRRKCCRDNPAQIRLPL